MTKKQRALIVIERLREAYPDADCTLEYEEAWKLLVSVRLAAQCTDARVNQIVPKLYEKYPDIDALAAATAEEIEEIVRPCGLGKSKARDINACMKMLRDEYESKVPEDFDALLRHTDSRHAYFGCHTDITIPYHELGDIIVNGRDGRKIPIIKEGRFVLPGTEALNEPLR